MFDELVVVPIGFLHEHMEVVFDLDVEVYELCEELNLTMVRAETPGLHPRFVQMIRELILERTSPGSPRLALGPMVRRPMGRRRWSAGKAAAEEPEWRRTSGPDRSPFDASPCSTAP